MKLSLSFLLFVAVFQFGSSNVLSKSGTQEQLSSDTAAVQNGSDVIMAKPGALDVILADGKEFVFEVCSMKCTADFLACYEPESSDQNVMEDSCDTKYGFYISDLGNKISFMKSISRGSTGNDKSDQYFVVIMNNGATSVLSSERETAKTTTYAPKVVNGIVKLYIMNAASKCSVSIKNAIIKHITTAPTTTTTLGQLGRTSSDKNAASTDEPGSFFADNWWIFLILGIILIAIGIGVGVYCYLRRKKNARKPMPARRRKLQGSESPVSTETQKGKTESAQKGRSGKRKINAIIKPETTTAPPTTTATHEQLDQTSSGENGHVSTSNDEPGSFFADYWRIFSVLGLIAVGVGVGFYCYLRRKKKSQKPVPVRRRKLQGTPQQNVTLGTCVSGTTESDSVMVPHRALQGTAKPTIFSTIFPSSGDADLTPHFLKNITHAFCYMHEMVDSSISVPHTLRSAEQMANRGSKLWHSENKQLDYSEEDKVYSRATTALNPQIPSRY
uniref:Piwi domain-containing protein n=1 Tax=Panagrolaimus davidi TaxID=227884 RepID=A0A914P556_9BILA